MGRLMIVVALVSVDIEQQTTTSGADWRRRRSRGGMVAVLSGELHVL